jgi:pyrroline-5-carboxylate reductase
MSRSVFASDPLESARTALAAETGATVFESNVRVAHKSDVLVLAVKPQSMPHALEHLRNNVTHLIPNPESILPIDGRLDPKAASRDWY